MESRRRMAQRGEPFSSRGHVSGANLTPALSAIYMKGSPETDLEQGPMGIVISRGFQAEYAPRFSAYMWAPDPEDSEDEDTEIEQKVA